MRIDKYLAGKFGSRTKAARAVEEGLVLVNGKVVSPSFEVSGGDDFIFLENKRNFVSLGGFKLAKALDDFGFSVKGGVFADIGASTGGFTDCLFQNGAKKVYCIDVGRSQLDASLLSENVVIFDNFNARNLEKSMFAEELDGVVVDVSFISLTYILSGIAGILGEGKHVIALVKPQFECGAAGLGKNGIVKNSDVRMACVKKIFDFALNCGLSPQKLTTAPIVKGKNIEYLFFMEKGGKAENFDKIIKFVKI